MPVNFGQYVYQPRPLQNWDFGAGLRDLAEHRLAERNSALLEQQNKDVNTRFAAGEAIKQNDADYAKANARYTEGNKLAELARDAWAQRDLGTLYALAPSLRAAGGTFTENPDGSFDIKGPDMPGRNPTDFAGMRQRIFGGTPASGQPFQMPSKFYQGPSPAIEGNPYDRLQGASAEAVPTIPSLGPSNAAPVDAASVRGSSSELPAGPLPNVPNFQLTGPNPLNTQAFSPYRLDTAKLNEAYKTQLKPFIEGVEGGSPVGFKDQAKAFGQGLMGTGLPPVEALKLGQTYFDQLAGIYRGGLAADAAAERAGASMENMAINRDDRRANTAFQNATAILDRDNYKKTKDAVKVAHALKPMLDVAVDNPNVAADLISQLYRLHNVGVMTDKDFEHAIGGVPNLWEGIKRGTLDKVFTTYRSLSPSLVADIRELVEMGLRAHKGDLERARDRVINMYNGARNEGEQEGYKRALRGFFDEEYWTPDMYDMFGVPMPEGMRRLDEPPAPSDNLGVRPLPQTGQQRPKASPSGTPLVKGSRVPEKPPRKPKQITAAEAESMSEDEAMEYLLRKARE